MNNNLYKLLTDDNQIRLFITDSSKMINYGILNSIRTDTVRQIYKKLITICSLLRGLLTEADQRLSVIIRFRVKNCSIHCDIDGNGNINCMLSPQLYQYSGDMSSLVGKGSSLSITRGSWLGGMFTGTVELNTPAVDHFFSYFFSKSDQTKTVFRTFTDGEELRGIMIQPLPFADDSNVKNVILTVQNNIDYLTGENWNLIMKYVFPYAHIIEEYSVQLECNCSKEMFTGMLMSLSIEDLRQSLLTDSSEEMECGICGKKYFFNRDDLEILIKRKENI